MSVRIPRRLKQRPHWKGLPIPFIATIHEDGTPDFRVTDHHKRLHVIKWKQCQLCGEPLGRYFFFVGGIISANQNAYYEPACHLDCLIYAMQVCPFIVGKMEHADLEKVKKDNPDRIVLIDPSYTAVKSGHWVITKADRWTYVWTAGGTMLLKPQVIKKSPTLTPPTMTPADWTKVMKDLL
jgi:hypothetical protein